MTVLDNTPRDQYTATGGQTVFAYTFEIAAEGDIAVLQNGVLLNLGTGAGEYAVTGVGSDTGGNITLVTAATSGDIITLYRDMALERLTSYTNGGDFLAADVNNDYDRLWLALQQNTGTSNRALVAPNTDPTSINMTIPDKATRLGKYLTFNSTTGNPEVGSIEGAFTAAGMNHYNFTGDGATVNFTLGMDPGGENNTQVYIDGVYQQKDGYNLSGAVVQFSVAPPNLSTIEVMVIEVLPVGATTASQVSFTQAGSTYGRNVQLKLQESVSVKDFGAVGDGVTDDTAAIQAAFDYVEINGGKLIFPASSGDWMISDVVVFGASAGVVVEFDSSANYLTLSQSTTAGGMTGSGDGANLTWINPRINANNFIGQNGIGMGANSRVEIIGGHFINFPVALDYTGGKAIAVDGVGGYLSVTGSKFKNCHSAINLKHDSVTDPSGSFGAFVISDVVAEDCDMFMYCAVKNGTNNDGTLFSVAVSNFSTINCGSLGGVFVFDRASNVKITNGSCSATASYNGGSPVASIFRGRGRKLCVDNVQINQDADSIINIDPLPNYAIDTSAMADNRYELVATGTYDYVFLSDLTDATHTHRFLNNTLIDVALSNDVGTAIVTPATRNGSTLLTIRNDYKVATDSAAIFNAYYANIASLVASIDATARTGSWTPTLTGAGGTAGSLAFTSAGTFTKVGNLMMLQGGVTLSALGSYTGVLSIGGVPENSSATPSYGSVRARSVTPSATAYGMVAQIGSVSASQIVFDYNITGSAGASMDWSELTSSSRIDFSITYELA